MLGRLALWLRIMGYDCSFVRHDRRDTALMLLEALEPGAVLLTRDTRLAARCRGAKVLLFREQRWRGQLRRLVRELAIVPEEKEFFTRCVRCNVPVVRISREEALPAVPPRSAEHDYDYTRCPACGRTYWPGTHLDAVKREIGEVVR